MENTLCIGDVMENKTIVCVQCERTFLFSPAEQEKFRARGFDPPRRCPECRERKSRVPLSDGDQNGRRRDRHRGEANGHSGRNQKSRWNEDW